MAATGKQARRVITMTVGGPSSGTSEYENMCATHQARSSLPPVDSAKGQGLRGPSALRWSGSKELSPPAPQALDETLGPSPKTTVPELSEPLLGKDGSPHD